MLSVEPCRPLTGPAQKRDARSHRRDRAPDDEAKAIGSTPFGPPPAEIVGAARSIIGTSRADARVSWRVFAAGIGATDH